MSREIKFRVYDTAEGDWHWFRLGDLVAGEFQTASEEGAGFDTLTWSQWTGLHDRNGAEIFEGDILKHTPELRGSHTVGWGVQSAGEPADGSYGAFAGWNVPLAGGEVDMEVVGNTYENPELLTNQE